MTEKECEQTIDELILNWGYLGIEEDLLPIKKLIKEHFNPSEYKFEELKEGSGRMTILLSNGEFAYIKDICICDNCKKRGEVEFMIVNENYKSIGYIKYHELNDKSIVSHYNPKDLCDLFHKKLIEMK